MAKKRISIKEARSKYGIVASGGSSLLRYYLLDNGNVEDSLGDIRYHAPKTKQKIVVPLSELDLEDLQHGEEFHWTFHSNTGEEIDVHVRPEIQEDIE